MRFKTALVYFGVVGSMAHGREALAESPGVIELPVLVSSESIQLVQPDFNASLLENLPAPVEPPTRVILPKLIVKKDEWRGSQCGITQPAQIVFRHGESWNPFWEKALAPYSSRLQKIPTIDFTKDMVIAVFMGEKPAPYYEIEIVSTQIEPQANPERTLVIRYRAIEKMAGVFSPPFAVQPFHLKKVTRFPGKVLFIQVRRK